MCVCVWVWQSFKISEPGPRQGKTCIVNNAGVSGPGGAHLPKSNSSCTDGGGRSYPELFYSGVLTRQQVDDVYETLTTSNNSKYATRPVTLGCAGYNNKQVTFWAYGLPYGLLQHDMVSNPYQVYRTGQPTRVPLMTDA